MVLGHEITGEIVEIGKDVEYLKVGEIVSVPFNVACGRCRTCREGDTGVCLNVNGEPERAGGAYGYVDMGGWIGGQAKFVMVPYADFNLLKFPNKDQTLAKILDLTMLSDILPTGFHGAVTAGVGVGSTVYVAGAGPVGLAAAASAQILGAAVVMIGDMNKERLEHAKRVGFEPIDLASHDRLEELIAAVVGVPEVDSAIDCVGFEARAYGAAHVTRTWCKPICCTRGDTDWSYRTRKSKGECRHRIPSNTAPRAVRFARPQRLCSVLSRRWPWRPGSC
jgi:glutathione-independent formaldehyde dehydrogenase